MAKTSRRRARGETLIRVPAGVTWLLPAARAGARAGTAPTAACTFHPPQPPPLPVRAPAAGAAGKRALQTHALCAQTSVLHLCYWSRTSRRHRVRKPLRRGTRVCGPVTQSRAPRLFWRVLVPPCTQLCGTREEERCSEGSLITACIDGCSNPPPQRHGSLLGTQKRT